MAAHQDRMAGSVEVCKRLFLGVALIVGAAAVLLLSDLRQRQATKDAGGGAEKQYRVAIFQIASRQILDDSVQGTIDGLAEEGLVQGRNLSVTRFNAEGDMVTANAIVQNILQGNFDLVATVSTPSLQTMANANRAGKLRHVFSVVTDPYGSGVGITGDKPGEHPEHLLGMGTFQPVRQVVQLARELYPDLKVAGTIINPGEACSQACLAMAQDECGKLGIDLLVAQVENSSGIYEAASSLAARGIEAFFIGGDNTVETSVESVFKAAVAARIPILAYAPDHVDAGALVGMGANYYEVGKAGGKLAGGVLTGRVKSSEYAIRDLMPRKLALNQQALAGLKAPWRIAPELLAQADILIDEQGHKTVRGGAAPVSTPALPAGKTWQLHMVSYSQSMMVEQWMRGFADACEKLGLRAGEDYQLTYRNAQGDMATANMMIDAAIDSRADILMTLTTPTLQAAVRKKPPMPVLFGLTANPLLAGAGKSDSEHLPGFTGISTMSDYEGMVVVIRECLPNARKIGTLYNPSEDNSVFNMEQMKEALAKAGLSMVTRATNEATEVPAAALALAGEDIDAICQVAGNLHDSSFPAIAQVARQLRKPLFAFVSGQALTGGAAIAVARDYEQGGRDHAALALRVMRGENPTAIPFAAISRTLIIVNTTHAAELGLALPPSLLQRADQVVDGKN